MVIEATLRNREVSIAVRDTGRGVAPELLPACSILPIDLSGARGFGIGVSVAPCVIDLHGGAMTVQSDGPGRGTEVVVTLRLHE